MRNCLVEIDACINEQCVHITVTMALVDNGIGAYEFWGQRCVDRRLEWERDSFDYEGDVAHGDVEAWLDDNMDDLIERANAKCEPDYDEPEPRTLEDW